MYKFQFKKDNQYRCISCEKLKKYTTVTVVDGRIIRRKHPVLDHHADCKPEFESAVQSLDLDRKTRVTVGETGKRPREVYNETLESISKKYQTSSEQEVLDVQRARSTRRPASKKY